MDVGVHPYSSKKSPQRPPFVGPLSDTRMHTYGAHVYIFSQMVNSFSLSYLVGGISRSIVKLTPHSHSHYTHYIFFVWLHEKINLKDCD